MAAENIGCEPEDITAAAKEDPRFRDQIADARADADIDVLKLLRRTASQEKNWRVAAWILERRNPEEYGRRSPNSFTGEQVMEIVGRVLETVMPSVPREEVAEVIREVEEELADVVAKARLPLPEFYAPEEEENDGESEGQGTPSRTAAETPPPDPIVMPPQVSPSAAASPAVERPTPAKNPTLNDGGKRASCLQQFVQRVPRAAPDGNGGRSTTLSTGKGQSAAVSGSKHSSNPSATIDGHNRSY